MRTECARTRSLHGRAKFMTKLTVPHIFAHLRLQAQRLQRLAVPHGVREEVQAAMEILRLKARYVFVPAPR